MFELAALGLLQGEALHGYRLKQQLELFMSSCVSVNYGTIYPLLKRLEERSYLSVVTDADAEAGSGRKIYSITEAGRQLWRHKMMEHPQESWVNARSRFMIKFFFFSYLTPAERIKLLEHRIMICRLRLESNETTPVPADPYQVMTLQQCNIGIQAELTWLTEQLHQEQRRSTDLPKDVTTQAAIEIAP